MSVKVSMIIACYNKAQYIGNTLRSIINQVWNNIEVILINDGSTDETLKIIKEWEPYLLEKGFKVIIINQDNQGVAAAIKKGLLYSSGEYICFPDADDELDREYVSVPIKLLENNKNVDFTVCELAVRKIPGGVPTPVIFTDEINSDTTIEQVLLQRVHSSICVYFIRREYAERCGLMNIITDQTESQEPQITTLLFFHGGKLLKIDKQLYIYNTFSSALAGGGEEKTIFEHYRNRLRLYEQTVDQLKLSSIKKVQLKGFASIGCWYMITSILTKGDASNEIFFRALTNNILKIKQQSHSITGRIIAFGSLGSIAKRLLPLMEGTPLQPDIFWDKAASSEDTAYDGSTVVKPDRDQLYNNDVIVCVVKSQNVFSDAKEMAKSRGAKILSWNYIIDYLADWYYPSLCDGIRGMESLKLPF
jgi:glycosyltransferase involved in cell wall biosynthesis